MFDHSALIQPPLSPHSAPWVTLMALWTLAREASLSSSTSSAVQDMQFSMSQLAVRYAQVVAAGVTTMDVSATHTHTHASQPIHYLHLYHYQALLKVSLFSASKKNCMRILGDAGLLQRESTTAVRLTDKGAMPTLTPVIVRGANICPCCMHTPGYRLGSVEAIKRRAAFLEKLAGGAGSLVGSASVPVASTQRPRERKRSRPSEGDGGGVSGGGAGGGAGATGNSSSSSSGSTLRRSHTTPAPSRRTRPRLETLAHTPTSSDHSPVHLMPRSCLRRDVMSRWRVVLLVDNREVLVALLCVCARACSCQPLALLPTPRFDRVMTLTFSSPSCWNEACLQRFASWSWGICYGLCAAAATLTLVCTVELCVLHGHTSHAHANCHCLAEFVMNHLVERKNVSASLSPLSRIVEIDSALQADRGLGRKHA